jgi:FlaA1/EpsC-like NDP-sugar epimerase
MANLIMRKAQSVTHLIVQALDFTAVCMGGWIAYELRFSGAYSPLEMRPDVRLLILGFAAIAALFFGKVYRLWPGGSLAAMLGRVTLGWGVAWVMLIVLLGLTKSTEAYSRIWLISWLLIGTVCLWLGRVAAFWIMALMRHSGYLHKSVVLYGNTNMLRTAKERIEGATWSGYDIVAAVTRGDGTDIGELDTKLKPDEIWISLSMSDQEQLEEVIHSLRYSVANIRLLPDLMMYQILNHGMSVNMGIPMVDISVSPMFGSRRLAKATLDYGNATKSR